MLQSLILGMEHGGEADLDAKVPGITSHFEQRCGAGVKEPGCRFSRLFCSARGASSRGSVKTTCT